MMSKTKIFAPIFALMLCLGAFLFPVTAFAQASDTTPPTVTATLSGDTLTVVAKDNDSGIAAIYINEHCFATLANGTASVQVKEYAGTGKQITVYATDTAGNRSTSVLIDNPYYQAPASTSTPAPSASSSTPTPAPSATAPSSTTTPSTSAPAPTPSSSTSDSSDSGSDADASGTETESAIGEGDSVTTPQGTGTVTEVATDEDGKLFYTIETPAGNVFYLVIDMVRTDGNNVYFLNAVTEDDLLALAEMDGSTTGGESAIPDTTDPEPAPAPEPTSDPEPDDEPEEESTGGGFGSIIFIVLAAAAVGGAAYYLKIVKPRQQAAMQDEEEYEDEEFDELGDDSDDEYLFADEAGEYPTGEDEGPEIED